MVLGKRELSAILLAIIAIVFYLVLLSTTPSEAQRRGGRTGGTTEQQNACASNEQTVQTFTGTQDKTTSAFQITGSDWRFIVAATATTPATGTVSVDAQTADGGFVNGSAITLVDPQFEQNASSSSNVIDGPGSFVLKVNETGANYSITVCQSASGGSTQANKSGKERSVVNVPNKPLPPSGGLPVYGVVAVSALAGAGLLALGLVIRCGSRR